MDQILEEDTQHGKFLTFLLGHESYGLEISYVKEIIGLQAITAMPGLPPYVKGIVNLRGKVIPVIDMRMRFSMEQSEYNDRTCIIVVYVGDYSVGLIVDKVAEVLTIDDGEIVKPPSAKTGANNSLIKGIGKVGEDVKLLLDSARLLDFEKISI